ncbi:hypothetical protein AB0N77_08295 [Streptomyces misionensis]|uniref:hypothetical protein n=1 Tax=Streptomyces TaxID=1883 RepID=UPI0034181D21
MSDDDPKNGDGVNHIRMIGQSFGVLLAATGLTVGAASMSNAASAANTMTASCSTTGASGSSVSVYGSDPWGEVKVTLRVKDTSADGHHVRVRYLTKGDSGLVYKWKWHSNTDGSGATKEWETTAWSTYGIYEKGVEVARFEGDTLLNSCVDWG